MPLAAANLECRLLDACIATYAISNGTLSPTAPGYADVGFMPGTAPTVFVDGVEGINAGFVGETFDGWVVIAYRGTLPPFTGSFWPWVEDWLHDFELGPMDWTVGGKVIGRVETGFGNAVRNTWPTVQAALGRMNLAGKKGILVTGHSKGGGMTFPACTLLKNLLPAMLVENCSYAAPLTCDRTFGAAYDAMGLKAFTVRYQNQFDIVPFLPYYPHFAMLASAERLFTGGVNNTMTAEKWPDLENDYLPLGALRYLGDGCQTEYGDQGETDATNALWHALDRFEFSKIADAHAASGRYHDCICGVAQSTLAIEAQT